MCNVHEISRAERERFKQNKKVQSRRRKRISEILALTDHNIEAVRSSKYLGTVNNNTNDETEEVKARIIAADTACSSPHTTYRCKQIHRNNKIKLYETLVKPVLCYRTVTWTQTQMTEREILRINGPVQEEGR